MSVLEAKRTTLSDFYLLVKSYQYRQLDLEYLASFTAWQMVRAQAVDAKGKPVIKRFDKLFDYKKAERDLTPQIERPNPQIDRDAIKLLASANKNARKEEISGQL